MGFGKMILYIVGCVVFLGIVSPLAAHPPSDIQVTYDLSLHALHIEMAHPTNNVNEHYIRRFVIYKNNEEVLSRVFPKQSSAGHLTQDVILEAKPDDTILVKVYSTEGGTGEASIRVSDNKTKP